MQLCNALQEGRSFRRPAQLLGGREQASACSDCQETPLKFPAFLITAPFIFNMAVANAAGEDGPKSVGVGIADGRGTSIGLRFTPPEEKGWSAERSGISLTLRRNTNSDSESKEIEAYMIRLDAPASPISNYVETIKSNLLGGYAGNKKFKISALEVAEDPKETRCARGHLLLEAIQPDQASQEKKWSEQFFLSCGLLKHKSVGFELRYYHRYADSKKDVQFAEEARRVLDSATIEDN